MVSRVGLSRVTLLTIGQLLVAIYLINPQGVVHAQAQDSAQASKSPVSESAPQTHVRPLNIALYNHFFAFVGEEDERIQGI
jgi:hypothetical protein